MKIKYLLLGLAVILTLLIIAGAKITHSASKQSNFIGIVGGHIYVDSPSQSIDIKEAHGCYSMYNNGAPGPFLAFNRLAAQRMVIISTDGVQEDGCGKCEVSIYTLFNKHRYNSPLNLREGCA